MFILFTAGGSLTNQIPQGFQRLVIDSAPLSLDDFQEIFSFENQNQASQFNLFSSGMCNMFLFFMYCIVGNCLPCLLISRL